MIQVLLKRDHEKVLRGYFLDLYYAEPVEARLAPGVLAESAVVVLHALGLLPDERAERLSRLAARLACRREGE